MKPFIFKQFKIQQDKTAMKIGTDGVLLGAWVSKFNANTILDIGAGTGLIAIMQAQNNLKARITAIEIEENAFFQAKENIRNCKWKNRIKVFNVSLQNFQAKEKFDLIISNPPFFNNTFKAKDNSRNIARQTESLSFKDLLKHTASLLSENGKACFIIPYSEMNNFVETALKNSFFLNEVLYIKGNINTKIKRVLLAFSFLKKELKEETISIEISRHHYTNEYIELVQDFYIKM